MLALIGLNLVDLTPASRARLTVWLAELSVIGLGADLIIIVAYQGLCLLFLTPIIAPFPRLGKLCAYLMPGL
jgi:hypothetical protein